MDFFENFDGVQGGNYLGFQGVVPSSSLILNNERGELMMNPSRQKMGDADKALIALRNHSNAERRRRERINAHLATLRTLTPGTTKMDKAGLLSEVINQVKSLRENVAEATKGTVVPSDIDEVRVEEEEDPNDAASTSIRASLCCDFKHELLSDLREAVDALPHNDVRAEISTLGTRMVSVFVITGLKSQVQPLVDSIRQTFRSILDKFYASEEFSSRSSSSKRRRVSSLFASSGSSSGLF
ncbi:transcription factor bHLH30-like [Salvia miltiorrhiza]|uniref:transcription factor bHLH30-like n=1 Tax=Salvia miltiorrhiza TaxID=226208 RepID=UPI0025AC2675|nr:transcription factor bHLH30-like [Salvia miltiorrhiza]